VTRAMRSSLFCKSQVKLSEPASLQQGGAQIFFSCPACFPRPLRSSSSSKLTMSPSLRPRNAGSFERTRVNESVLAALIRLNKTKSFRCVEELHRPVHHSLRWRLAVGGASQLSYTTAKTSYTRGLQITPVCHRWHRRLAGKNLTAPWT